MKLNLFFGKIIKYFDRRILKLLMKNKRLLKKYRYMKYRRALKRLKKNDPEMYELQMELIQLKYQK